MTRKILFSLAPFLLTLTLHGQPLTVYRGDTVHVINGNRDLLYPWAGGHNNCQFSEMDFDGDSIKDLFVFDRTGNRVTTFKNLGTPNQVDLVYAPQYQSMFPRMLDWALLRDYNRDGKTDIFTGRWGGISVWKNVTSGPGPQQFQHVVDTIRTIINPASNPQLQFLFVNQIDIPAIRDVDGDGDLDIVSFHTTGLQIDYHQNMSMETYGTADSLHFTNTSRCWGYLFENAGNPQLTLNVNCGDPTQRTGNLNLNLNSNPLHSGSCTECVDVDADGDLEPIIGDISSDGLQLARNGGTPLAGLFDSIDTQYPSYDTPVSSTVFPCGFQVDVDNDGAKDLLVSPSAPFTSENFKSVWFYHNTGRTDSMRLQFVQNNFLQANEIEVGDGAYPVLYDYDNDGKLDLFIGNYGAYTNSIFQGKISLYQNTGTTTAPAFELVTTDFADIYHDATGILNPMPAFGDLDGDGDKDMLVGDADGKLHFYEKQPGPADNFVLTIPNYMGIDIGAYAAPQLVDVDHDGLLDLLVGEQSGNINYFHNTGTTTSPSFTSAPTIPVFGGVDVRQNNFLTGYSAPLLFEENGQQKLISGAENGWIHIYDSITGNLSGNFHLIDTSLYNIREGLRVVPTMGDLNGDSVMDFVIGNYAGGVALFYGDNSVGIAPAPIDELTFSLYPNPASQQITLVLPEAITSETATLTIVDVSGREVLSTNIHSGRNSIDAQNFPSGMYFCTVVCGERVGHKKVMVKH